MSPIITRSGVIARGYVIEVGRQGVVGEKRGRARSRADVGGSQVPARPSGLTQIITKIEGFHGALNQVMVVVIGVGGGTAGIAQLHLQRSVNDGIDSPNEEEQG